MEPYLFFSIGDLAVLTPRILSADAGDDWTLQEAILESGEEAVEQPEGEAEEDSDKQGIKTLAFRMLRLQRPQFCDGENTS